ncbi:MAG: tRNA uridine-5-carboxymethylaminomethyl(34) synthesis enzyme MnmG [Rickettsiales bacterium]|nr:tRNA uridine-5-carboxymethylaminomethyl(34) synthesis enzyme MnmG [Rickettsiales bacterium]
MAEKNYDVIVVGAGHAGVEAAAAAARMGCRAALVTFSRDNIGEMSCNPSVGGLGKGHLVREVDALDGIMARAADAAGTQFRVLNSSKGAAVQGPRAQVDRALYKKAVSELLSGYPNLEIIEDEAVGFDGLRFELASGRMIESKAAVVSTGTFLNGAMHVGEEKTAGGRAGEKSSAGIAESLKRAGFSMIRLKTGTPPRLLGATINYAGLEVQESDAEPEAFSFMTERLGQKTLLTHIAHTNARTHGIILANKHRSPLYNGQIKSIGPRYCPSIEDKAVRFAHHASHHVFLEPEGYGTDVVYPNGISTSLPKDVQDEFVRSIKGLENVKIPRYGYAVEYDAVDARELRPTLESKRVAGLFLAGQINGTSGYEEAAGQGILAGINAALHSHGKERIVLDRSQAFIGVMVDDITTLGVDEPYRMFTSRSEYRLSVRADNADRRLTPLGIAVGAVEANRAGAFDEKMEKIARGDISDAAVRRQMEIEGKYAGYLRREEKEIEAYRRDQEMKIPDSLDYSKIGGLTLEARAKLERARPATLAGAARIQGITPAALTALLKFIKK